MMEVTCAKRGKGQGVVPLALSQPHHLPVELTFKSHFCLRTPRADSRGIQITLIVEGCNISHNCKSVGIYWEFDGSQQTSRVTTLPP